MDKYQTTGVFAPYDQLCNLISESNNDEFDTQIKSIPDPDNFYKAALFSRASKHGNVRIMGILLDMYPGLKNAHLGTHFSDYMACAVRSGNPDAIKFLILEGANVHTIYKNKRTLLHMAAKYCCFECARTLLDYGIDSETKNGRGLTARGVAAARGNMSIVELIDQYGMTKGVYD